MRTCLILAILFLMAKGSLIGQTVHTLSLDESIKLALQNAEELKNLRLDEEIQVFNNKEVTGATYPQISASGQGSYYTNLPQIQFPSSNYPIYQVLQDEGVKDRQGNEINVNKATTSSQAVSFVAPLNFQFGLAVNQLLFQPDIFIAFKARETVLQYSRDNIKVSENNIKEAVQKSYFSVLIAEQQKKVLEETLQRLDKLSAEMAEMYKNGFVEKLDLDKLAVSQNNTKTALNQLDNAIKISKSLLKNTIGIEAKDDVTLSEKLDAKAFKDLLVIDTGNFNYDMRSEIVLLHTARKLQELDIKRQESAILPTVGAFYQLQRAGQRNPSFAPPGESPWFWYTTGLIGISVTQPIFDGFQRKNKINQAKLKLVKVDNSLGQVKRLIDMEQDIAKNSLNSALLNLEVQERNTALAKEVFESTKKKYESGLGSSLEIIQTDTDLQRAQGNYFQALYDCYVAKIAMDKAFGKL